MFSSKGRGEEMVIKKIQIISYGVLLGALYQQLTLVIKDKMVKYQRKRSCEEGRSNIQRCSWEYIFAKGKLSSLSFSLYFPLPLNYIILHHFIYF